jgi:hypothetical protein
MDANIREVREIEGAEEERAGRKRKLSFKRLGALLLLLAAAGLIISEATGATRAIRTIADLLNPPMHFIEAGHISHEVGAAARIHAAEEGFFLATRDAMRFHNADGAEIFRHGHAMGNPTLFGRGGYAALLEHSGRLFHVYSGQGLLYSIPTGAPITRFSLGPQGFSAVIMDGSSGSGIYQIEIYDNFGTMIYYGLHVDENILPMLMDISHDGRVLAISYLDINDAQMNSFISFVSIDGSHVGADYIFAQNRHNPGQIIGAMRFLADGSLAVVSDTRIFVLNGAAATVWEKELDNRFTHVDFGDNWFAVAYGDAMLNRPGVPPGTVIAYNAFGTELFVHSTPAGAVRHMQAMGSNLVVGWGDGYFAALSAAGQVLWELTLPGNVQDIGMMGNGNNVVSLSPTQTNVLRRVRGE